MLGVSPFAHTLAEGIGARLWVASEDGAPGGPCPFCARPMRQVPPQDDGSAGIAACHRCEQVWVPPSAGAWVAAHAARPAAGSEPPAEHSLRCDGCGAPWEPDGDGRCRFCHVQLSTPQAVVVTLVPARRPGDRLLDAITGLLDG